MKTYREFSWGGSLTDFEKSARIFRKVIPKKDAVTIFCPTYELIV
jgi:hypothetical protein